MPAVSYPTCKSQEALPSQLSSLGEAHDQPNFDRAEDEDSALDLPTPGSQLGGDDVFSPSLTPSSTWSSISSTAEDPVVREFVSSHATSGPSVEYGSVGSSLIRSDRLCGFNSKRPYSSTCEPCSEDRYEHDRFTGMAICLLHLDTMQRLSKGDSAVEKLLSGFRGGPRLTRERVMAALPSGDHGTHQADRGASTVEGVSAAPSDAVQ